MSNGCLYIFLDEGGNLDFAASGTKYFTLTSVCTKRPFTACHELGKYKFDLIEYGFDFSYFHCTKDNRHVRQRVFGIIKNNIADLRVDSLIVEKSKIVPALQASEEFYPRMLGHLIRHVAEQEREELDSMKELIVITDSIPIKKKRAAVEKAQDRTEKNAAFRLSVPGAASCLNVKHGATACGLLQLGDIQKMGIRGLYFL